MGRGKDATKKKSQFNMFKMVQCLTQWQKQYRKLQGYL